MCLGLTCYLPTPGTNFRCGGCGTAPTASLPHPIALFLEIEISHNVAPEINIRAILHLSAPYHTHILQKYHLQLSKSTSSDFIPCTHVTKNSNTLDIPLKCYIFATPNRTFLQLFLPHPYRIFYKDHGCGTAQFCLKNRT